MTDEERAEYAHSIGYRQIGKDLPRGVTLQQVISTLPKQVRHLRDPREDHLQAQQVFRHIRRLVLKASHLSAGTAVQHH